MNSRIDEKLSILADAAKYDVSCASSGSSRKSNGGLGNTGGGICHSYSEDGRCISLLKILLTNHCIFDCAFCVSRKSNDVKRAAFTVDEVVSLTINFYRRNYIEGLFLSSGIFKNPDYTMERLLRIARRLRLEENFHGYIHIKTIPGASEELIKETGLYADRMSINLEFPTESGLKLLAPEKSHEVVKNDLGIVRNQLLLYRDDRKRLKHTPKFVPAGQSTQMVIGATKETDKDVLHTAVHYYRNFGLKRVYYSGYIPVSNDERLSAVNTPPLIRENRLYQTDWLLRFYNFSVDDIVNDDNPNLDLDIDPKLSWALRNPQVFPVDVNTASFEDIIKVPGIGINSAKKIISARSFGKLHIYQLKKIGIVYSRAQYFIRCADSVFTLAQPEPSVLKEKVLQKSSRSSTIHNQLSLFV